MYACARIEVADRPQRVALARVAGEAGHRDPRDRPAALVAAQQHRVVGRAAVELVERDERADREALGRAVGLRRHGEQPALRDRRDPLRADPGGQHVHGSAACARTRRRRRRRSPARSRRTGTCARPMRRDLEPFGLVALVLRARLRVVAGTHDLVLERRAGLVLDPAAGVEEREAAAAALVAVRVHVVALVGGRERVVVDPLDRVGLAPPRDRLHERDHAVALRAEVVLGRVDADEVDAARREVPLHARPAQVDDREVVVLLQAHDRFVARVDVDVLGLGVLRRDGRDPGQVDGPQARGRSGRRCRSSTCSDAGRQLRDQAVVLVLVALVLDHDRRVAPVGRRRRPSRAGRRARCGARSRACAGRRPRDRPVGSTKSARVLTATSA